MAFVYEITCYMYTKQLEVCAQNPSDHMEIGFHEEETSSWFPLIKVCFDPSTKETYYTDHVLQGLPFRGES